ncbi:Beta-glucosidase [Purpureocillium lavendulum]|uniref:beta-glucosidase n=1 Tax=Purpureocillium lavendulum TaxID=1247861 RepID=A0AB34FQ20_9HYPO|nr:Beta-glucosidase [Purpureocillium lavendulum]
MSLKTMLQNIRNDAHPSNGDDEDDYTNSAGQDDIRRRTELSNGAEAGLNNLSGFLDGLDTRGGIVTMVSQDILNSVQLRTRNTRLIAAVADRILSIPDVDEVRVTIFPDSSARRVPENTPRIGMAPAQQRLRLNGDATGQPEPGSTAPNVEGQLIENQASATQEPARQMTAEGLKSYRRAKDVVDQMTLAEKTNITSGTGIFKAADEFSRRCSGNTGSAQRLGIPQLCINDAPAGVHGTDHVTVFPGGITTGATFDKRLMRLRGASIGKEARGKGANALLGPVVGPLGRKPRGGRNWESFGADPVLQAIAGRETILGMQSEGVIATLKHYVGNEQEMHRMYNGVQDGYSSNIDDRTLHELYLWPFAEGVRAGVGSVMTAYNAVNGSACSQNPYLINGILKDELGFQGFVMTDWLGQMSGVASALAGLDMAMPGDTQVPIGGQTYWMYELTRAVLNGSVPLERVNDMATRILATRSQMGQDAPDYPAPNFDENGKDEYGPLYPGSSDSPMGVVNQFVDVTADHDSVARQVAQEAITMLKNDAGLLPLDTTNPLYIFGTAAQVNPDGANNCSDRACNKGTLGQGWGSGSVDYMRLDDPIGAIRKRVEDVTFHNSDTFPSEITTPKDDDVAIIFITSDSGEGSYRVEGNHGDRDASGLYAWHDGDKLVQDAAAKYKNVVVVAQTVGPLILERWVDLPAVKSVLIAHLPGQEAGRSLAEVLFGDASPCGHLPYSIVKREEDMPRSVTELISNTAPNQPQDTYTEGLYIDYRWLNRQGITPRYAFGHGLSYTTFSYTDAKIERVMPMSEVPPVRKPKSGLLNYTQPIPPPDEAVKPSGFHLYTGQLYSWLSKSDAQAATRDAMNITKRYPYPKGYSTEQRPGPRAGGGEGGNPALWDVAYRITVKVTNTGRKHAGKASVQAYVQFPEGSGWETPRLQLRDFEKTTELAPGQSQTVELHLTRKDLSVWDVVRQDWVVPHVDGGYTVWLGAASDDFGVVCSAEAMRCEEVQGVMDTATRLLKAAFGCDC